MKPEAKTQTAILEWLKLSHSEVYGNVIKIDNEGKRSIAGHILAVRMGLHKGASDLFIAWPTELYHGLFLEVKPDKWKANKSNQSHVDNQLFFIAKMRKLGYFADICVGTQQGIDIITTYLKEVDTKPISRCYNTQTRTSQYKRF